MSGWIADMKCVHNLSLLGGVILSIGVTTMIVAVIPTLETLITYSALYGLLAGALIKLRFFIIAYIKGYHVVEVIPLQYRVYIYSS